VGDGIEGLVHISEMAVHHVDQPEQVVTPGEELWVKIIDIDLARRRISLSIKQAAEGGEVAAEYREAFGEHAYDEHGNYIGAGGYTAFEPESEAQAAWAGYLAEQAQHDTTPSPTAHSGAEEAGTPEGPAPATPQPGHGAKGPALRPPPLIRARPPKRCKPPSRLLRHFKARRLQLRPNPQPQPQLPRPRPGPGPGPETTLAKRPFTTTMCGSPKQRQRPTPAKRRRPPARRNGPPPPRATTPRASGRRYLPPGPPLHPLHRLAEDVPDHFGHEVEMLLLAN